MATRLQALRKSSFHGPAPRRKSQQRLTAGTDGNPCGESEAGSAERTSKFEIAIRFLGGLSQSQQNVFETAAARWSTIIVGDLQSVQLPTGEVVDDVLIDASGVNIDGAGGVLGRAGPQFVRANSLPAKGIMEFDTADLARMEADGSLADVIVHEMGHVLGIGTIWSDLGLLVGCATANPVFLGERAMHEFGQLIGADPTPVPVANTGGPGTRCGHWRDALFGNELMTGFLNVGTNPVSRMTIASIEDLGYEVSYDAADLYALPTPPEIAMMGIGADGHRQHCQMCGGGTRPVEPIVLPEEAYVE